MLDWLKATFIGLLLTTQVIAANAAPSETLLTVVLNGQALADVYKLLQLADGQLLAKQDDFRAWRIKLSPGLKPYVVQTQKYYLLSQIPGLRYKLDSSKLQLQLQVDVQGLQPSTSSLRGQTLVKPPQPSLGAYVNYLGFMQTDDRQTQWSGWFDTNIFGRLGVLSNDFLLQKDATRAKLLRLNSTWTRDDPTHLRTLRLGDSFTTAGGWGNQVGFAGVQLASNFATQPSFVTFPLPSVKGESVVPTTVDLYLNNSLIANRNMPAGPFTLQNIPVVTGEGTLNVVTTDILGRQQIVNIPFYGSSNLLKPGLHDYALEAGFVRRNFGLASNDYGRFLITATDKIGITERFTLEEHGEALLDQQAAGIGGNYLLGRLGVVSASLAGSHANFQPSGTLASLGFQRQAQKGISWGTQWRMASRWFAQLGLEHNQPAPHIQGQFSMGLPLAHSNSVGLSYVQQSYYDKRAVRFLSASYSKLLPYNLSFILTGMTHVGGEHNRSVFATLVWPLNERTTASAQGSLHAGNNAGNLQITRNLPTDDGWGYNLQANQGSLSNYQASLTRQNRYGRYQVAAASQRGNTGYQLQATGSLVWLDHDFYVARNLGDAFGLVKLAEQKDVTVYLNNQAVGKTDRQGRILLPNLLPYNDNAIRLDFDQLPLTTSATTDSSNVIPYWHSGSVVNFNVTSLKSGMVKLTLPNGDSVPVGATVTTADKSNDTIVVNEGKVYLTALQTDNTLQVNWEDNQCQAVVHYALTDKPIADLGTVVCHITS
jgi:outer membrane usher protein